MSTPYQSIRHKKCRNQHRHRLSYFAVVRIWGVSWVIFFSLSLLFFWFIFEDFQLTTTTIDAEFCVWNDFRPLFEALYWKVRLRFQSRLTKFIEKKRRVRTSQNEWSNYDYSLLNRLQSGNLCVLHPHHVLLDHRCRHIDSWKYDISIINANE